MPVSTFSDDLPEDFPAWPEDTPDFPPEDFSDLPPEDLLVSDLLLLDLLLLDLLLLDFVLESRDVIISRAVHWYDQSGKSIVSPGQMKRTFRQATWFEGRTVNPSTIA